MTLKVGVIGTGMIGREHIQRLSRKLVGAEVVAVSDVNPQAAQAAIEGISGAKVHGTGEALIASPDVHALVVTSSGATHEAYVLGGIAAGKPVFCEKPLATSAAACLRIVEAEVASGRPLVQVGFQRRYDKGYLALKKIIDDGEIGAPLMIHAAHRNASVPDFYVRDMEIVDTFVHEIDVLRWLINDDYVSAQVLMARKSRHAHERLDDPIMVLLETKSGIRIDGEVFVNCRYGYDIQCQVVGEDGLANLPDPESVPMRKAGVAHPQSCRTGRNGSSTPTMRSCRTGSAPHRTARSTARPPGTAISPPSPPTPAFRRSARARSSRS